MKKITVIGHFDWKKNNMIGAVVKARNIYEELVNQFGFSSVGSVDIYGWRKNKQKIFLEIIMAFSCSKNIILVCSDTTPQLMRVVGVLKKVFHNKIYYCVVGGDIAENLKDNPNRICLLNSIDYFFVETVDCLNDMKRIGIINTELLRNFKCIKPIEVSDLHNNYETPFKFCTFSRVIEQKGITDAITAVESINDEACKEICSLDIYGPVDSEYKDRFEYLIKNSNSCHYCGIVDSTSSVKILKDYYCLLFPTKYQTEGIPGTIIDGFAAGLPVICADWCRCRQLVTDRVDGLIYSFDDYSDFVSTIKIAIANPDLIAKMRKNCLKSFYMYQSDNAILPLLKRLKSSGDMSRGK